jgi:hypothetical protein
MQNARIYPDHTLNPYGCSGQQKFDKDKKKGGEKPRESQSPSL